ncbi:flavodoxin family protein [Brachyspira murdochii]|uniref:flavodoxin family protein n=1 Tax=Brachyspira murdochii TaxID=84378 RepID=UPI003005C34F
MKKILILNGSPRINGNTAALIEEFIKGAKLNGNDIIKFDLDKMNIHGCKGCLKGGKDKESPCTQKDDMLKIYPHYKEADILVLASPMYYWAFSAQLKTAIDRLFAVTEIDSNYKTPYKEWQQKEMMKIIQHL